MSVRYSSFLMVASLVTGSTVWGQVQCKVPPAAKVLADLEKFADDGKSIFEFGKLFTGSPKSATYCSGLFPPHPDASVMNFNPLLDAKLPLDERLELQAPSEAALLTNGEISLAARLQTAEGATQSIDIEALVFSGDESGQKIAEILKRKVKQDRVDGKGKISVRVIVDGISNTKAGDQGVFEDLIKSGIEVLGAEVGFSPYLHWFDDTKGNTTFSRVQMINMRFHDKMWIVDGESDHGVAIVGGMNVANEYFRVDQGYVGKWRDQDVFLRGPVVKDVVATFNNNLWYHRKLKSEVVSRPLRKGIDIVGQLDDRVFKSLTQIQSQDPAKKALVEEAYHRDLSRSLHFVPAEMRWIRNRPRTEETYIEQAYYSEIVNSTNQIIIMNPYFVAPLRIKEALLIAAKKGTKITIYTNGSECGDSKMVVRYSRGDYHDLLSINRDPDVIRQKNFLHIREWVGKNVGEGMIHAKFGIFDFKRLIIGSYNLDPRSAFLNSETVIAINNETLAKELAKFNLDWDRPRSVIITEEQAKKWVLKKGQGTALDKIFDTELVKGSL